MSRSGRSCLPNRCRGRPRRRRQRRPQTRTSTGQAAILFRAEADIRWVADLRNDGKGRYFGGRIPLKVKGQLWCKCRRLVFLGKKRLRAQPVAFTMSPCCPVRGSKGRRNSKDGFSKTLVWKRWLWWRTPEIFSCSARLMMARSGPCEASNHRRLGDSFLDLSVLE